MSAPFKPAPDAGRWAVLGLADPPLPENGMPEDATTADLLAWALCYPGSIDPIEGLLEGVRVELVALSDAYDVLDPRSPSQKAGAHLSDTLLMLARRLEVAVTLLRRTDGTEPLPPEDDPEAGEAGEADDPEITQDGAPSGEKPS